MIARLSSVRSSSRKPPSGCGHNLRQTPSSADRSYELERFCGKSRKDLFFQPGRARRVEWRKTTHKLGALITGSAALCASLLPPHSDDRSVSRCMETYGRVSARSGDLRRARLRGRIGDQGTGSALLDPPSFGKNCRLSSRASARTRHELREGGEHTSITPGFRPVDPQALRNTVSLSRIA